MRPLAATALASLALAACAAPSSYMGVSFAPGTAASDLQELARRAQAGDKLAQLDLGIAYEEGRGVVVDLKGAERLYRLAAADSGGTVWTYSPPTGGGTIGRVIPIKLGRSVAGLTEARYRLEALREFTVYKRQFNAKYR